MNEELEQRAIIALQKMIESTVQADDFILEQTPDSIQQFLAWKFVEHLVSGGLLTFIMVMFISIFFFNIKYIENSNTPTIKGIFCFTCGIIGMFLLFPFFCYSIPHFMSAVQIYIAPKIFLIEYYATQF